MTKFTRIGKILIIHGALSMFILSKKHYFGFLFTNKVSKRYSLHTFVIYLSYFEVNINNDGFRRKNISLLHFSENRGCNRVQLSFSLLPVFYFNEILSKWSIHLVQILILKLEVDKF